MRRLILGLVLVLGCDTADETHVAAVDRVVECVIVADGSCVDAYGPDFAYSEPCLVEPAKYIDDCIADEPTDVAVAAKRILRECHAALSYSGQDFQCEMEWRIAEVWQWLVRSLGSVDYDEATLFVCESDDAPMYCEHECTTHSECTAGWLKGCIDRGEEPCYTTDSHCGDLPEWCG